MRTSLRYNVLRETKIDYATGTEVSKIKSRGYDFCVSGAKSEAEHMRTIESFEKFLSENGWHCDGFGSGTWEECVSMGNTKDFVYLSIPVQDTDEREEVAELYTQWKTTQKHK